MLHEIIVTLSGVSGKLLQSLDYFIDLKPFLHPSEMTLLEKLLKIAKDYKYLKDFIEVNHVSVFDEEEHELRTSPGLYIQAFCEGLEEVLKPYRKELVKLEANILIGPQVTLMYIFSVVDSYSSLFAIFTSIVNQILAGKFHGCQILQILYENILNNVEEVKESLESILHQCHIVFLKQTTNWLINGHLIDSFQEFIIRKAPSHEPQIDESVSSALSNTRNTVVGRETDGEYEIVLDFVPLYINYTLVNDILFVGQIVKILYENPRSRADTGSTHRNLIFEEKETQFFEKFTLLKDDMSLDMRELEGVVHDIRECVVKHLWKMAVEEENLYEELQLLKNFYLLGLGQFFKEFLSVASTFFLQSSKSQYSDLNVAMNQVASSFPFIDEKSLEKFKFIVISSKDKNTSNVEETIWSSVQLQYTAKWPLNLLFKPVAIEHYNKLFFFLLRIKRCHMELHNVWKTDTKNKKIRYLVFQVCGKAWKLRYELMFLISNLQFYLQVDVIETEYCNLINSIQKVQDFQQIQKLHNIFLLNVLSHSFLLDIPTDTVSNSTATLAYSEHFYNALINIVKISEKFCLLSSKGDMDKREKEITRLDRGFQKYKTIVLCFLSEYQSQPFKQHVSKFLLRLNFNHWIDKNLLTIQPE